MADDGLIEAYLNELSASLRWHCDVTDIVAEAEDHLRSKVEQLVADGADAEAAQRGALAQFGGPSVVARGFALTRHGRLAIPTRSTKSAGVIAMAGGALWLSYPAIWVFGGLLWDRVGDSSSDSLGGPAELLIVLIMGGSLLGAAGLLLGTWFTLHERHGGFGLFGTFGIGISGLGALATLFGWFMVGWGSLLAVGTLLVSVELWRRDLAPKLFVLATGGGLTVGALIWGVLRYAEVGRPDQFGDYQIANITALAIGSVVLGIGLFGIGRWLVHEDPVEIADSGTSQADLAIR